MIKQLICWLVICVKVLGLFQALSFSKQLFIPGGYYSLINFTQSTLQLNEYYDISIDFNLTQTATSDQGNSVYDLITFATGNYQNIEPCYQKAVTYLNSLYDQFQPCQGGCDFVTSSVVEAFNNNYTSINLLGSSYTDQTSIIIDNTFYPCSNGVYQSQIYLYQSVNLIIESNVSYFLILKIICVVLIQVLIFLIAYIPILAKQLQDKKKRLKKMMQDKESQDVLKSFQQSNVHP